MNPEEEMSEKRVLLMQAELTSRRVDGSYKTT
jgi:hypothetical protein